MNPATRTAGFTLIELLVSLAIAALLLTAMAGLVDSALQTRDDARLGNDALQDARFAMQRMVTATRSTDRLLLPLADNPNTNWRENVREQTVPASPPEGDSTLATAVLAVTLDPYVDLDDDLIDDADNDKDGRVDEDPGDDATNDLAPGIINIDDDGDGAIDEGSSISDDDEDGAQDEDAANGIDDDDDGAMDEDLEGSVNDDGDGSTDEDWLDVVAFYLNGSTLIERRPNLNAVDGNDFSEHVIAENVTRFRVERIPDTGKRAVLIDLTLEIAEPGGQPVSLNTRLRVGGVQ